MALSNAERQARYQARLKQRAKVAITPDDVVEAVRLLYEDFRKHEDCPPFAEWMAEQATKKRNNWAGFLPYDTHPDTYEDFSAKDADLLIRVAAVRKAMLTPPEPSEGST